MAHILQLKIHIPDSSPEIWRRLLIAQNQYFIDLHEAIQVLFDWGDEKNFHFENETIQLADPEEMDDPEGVTDVYDVALSELFNKKGDNLDYFYYDDFGKFELNVELEAILPEEDGIDYPHCMEAAQAAPKEAANGLTGYYEMLEAYQDVEHDEHYDMLEWFGENFDPNLVNIDEINEELQRDLDALPALETVDMSGEEAEFIVFNELLQEPHLEANKLQLESARQQFLQYKEMGEKAMAQVPEQGLFFQFNEQSNSIALIVKHLRGNMLSRWTDFLTTDGEKEWRNRDTEFEDEAKTRSVMLEEWEEGWAAVFTALDGLEAEDWDATVFVRKQGHLVWQAVNRQIAHYAYHIGQIVFLSKMLVGMNWESLSIPKGKSEEFNKKMGL